MKCTVKEIPNDNANLIALPIFILEYRRAIVYDLIEGHILYNISVRCPFRQAQKYHSIVISKYFLYHKYITLDRHTMQHVLKSLWVYRHSKSFGTP